MDYALAEALKVAGFPQEGRGMRVPPPDKIVAWPGDFAYVPTLEELIEACGHNENMSLYLGLFGSHAVASKGRAAGSGKTPTDAVARLWLALISE
jgi:hypothetical protein